MRETLPVSGPGPEGTQGNLVHVPRIPEELYGYFLAREATDSAFEGYADLAALAADAIDEARRHGKTDEMLENDFAILPGRSSGVRPEEVTPASRELMELVFATHKLEPVMDETTENNPYGRILWQNSERGVGINVIETRWLDEHGDLVKLTAVSHVPEDLLLAESSRGRFQAEIADELESIPVIDVEELDLVKGSFRKAA